MGNEKGRGHRGNGGRAINYQCFGNVSRTADSSTYYIISLLFAIQERLVSNYPKHPEGRDWVNFYL